MQKKIYIGDGVVPEGVVQARPFKNTLNIYNEHMPMFEMLRFVNFAAVIKCELSMWQSATSSIFVFDSPIYLGLREEIQPNAVMPGGLVLDLLTAWDLFERKFDQPIEAFCAKYLRDHNIHFEDLRK